MEPEPVQITQDAIVAPLPQEKKKPWILAILVLVLLVLAGGAYYYFSGSTATLRGLHVLEVGDKGAMLKVFGFNGLNKVSAPAEGTVIDYASSATTKAFLVVDAEQKASVVLAGSEPVVLYRGTGDLAGLVVSEDGMTVAVAELDPARKNLDFESIDAWTVHVFGVSGTKIVSTSGYAPHFFTSKGVTYLMVTAPNGITIVDLTTGVGVTEAILDSTRITRTATVSPSGAYVAIPDASVESYTLYGITSLTPLRFVPLWSLKPELYSVAWDKDTLYGVSRKGDTTSLYSFQTFAKSDGTLRYTFPQASAYYRITP